jgi:hypothetical protein
MWIFKKSYLLKWRSKFFFKYWFILKAQGIPSYAYFSRYTYLVYSTCEMILSRPGRPIVRMSVLNVALLSTWLWLVAYAPVRVSLDSECLRYWHLKAVALLRPADHSSVRILDELLEWSLSCLVITNAEWELNNKRFLVHGPSEEHTSLTNVCLHTVQQ